MDGLLPTTYLTVLTLIGRGAKYGYEINEIIDRHGYRNWVDLQFSSIYKALRELESKGLIKGIKEDQSVKGSKKIYSLTRKGTNTLRKQIMQCLSDPPRAYTVFDLGLSAMGFLTKEEALEALKRYRRRLSDNIAFLAGQAKILRNIDAVMRDSPSSMVGVQQVSDFDGSAEIEIVAALFERPLRSIQCQAEWLDNFIQKVESGTGFTFSTSKD